MTSRRVGYIAGFLSAFVFFGLDWLMLRWQLDDVVAAVPMHAGCGVLGILLVGFFARQEYVEDYYGTRPGGARRWGLFFGGDGTLLACQVMEVLLLSAWTVVFTGG